MCSPAPGRVVGPVTWTPISGVSLLSHQYLDSTLKNPVGSGIWTAIVTRKDDGNLRVQVLFSEDTVLWYTIVNDPLPEPCGVGICDDPPVEQQIQGAMPLPRATTSVTFGRFSAMACGRSWSCSSPRPR